MLQQLNCLDAQDTSNFIVLCMQSMWPNAAS